MTQQPQLMSFPHTNSLPPLNQCQDQSAEVVEVHFIILVRGARKRGGVGENQAHALSTSIRLAS